MAITFRELPEIAKHKIMEAKISAIQKIIAHDYPSGQTEVSVYGKDSHGWDCCKIFSF